MRRTLSALLFVAAAATRANAQASAPARPSLVLFFTIDQLRPDYLKDFGPQLTGGLARLLKSGAYFENGFQDHAVTETAPGHASTMSGRFPRSTGIVANDAGVLDVESPLIGARGDPASPFRFRGTVLYDWMRMQNPRSRALSVSRKDRGAILPLGRAKGEAFWWGANPGIFTTSKYYADTLPTWVKDFNAQRFHLKYTGRTWDLLLPASAYQERDSVAAESNGSDFLFPHFFPRDSGRVAAAFQEFPMMDELILQFALAGANARQLGRVPGRMDLLAVSLSTTDAVGHRYGPDSREIHDQVLRLDRYLGAFLDSLYQLVDSSKVVIALTADHGVAPFPQGSVASRFRTDSAGTVDIRPIAAAMRRAVIAAGVDSTAFRYEGEALQLEPTAFATARVNRDSVARAYAREVSKVPGVLRADLLSVLRRTKRPNDVITQRWLHMYPDDLPVAVVVTLRPFWYWNVVQWAQHGTPHDHDARVPVLFAGAGVKPGAYLDRVRVVDMAPTLADLIGVRPAELLDGVVLAKVKR